MASEITFPSTGIVTTTSGVQFRNQNLNLEEDNQELSYIPSGYEAGTVPAGSYGKTISVESKGIEGVDGSTLSCADLTTWSAQGGSPVNRDGGGFHDSFTGGTIGGKLDLLKC